MTSVLERTDDRSPGAAEHRVRGLVHLSVADVVSYRLHREPRLTRIAEAALPTSFGTFRALGYRDRSSGGEHLALVAGTGRGDVPVLVHDECLSGDVFGAGSCRCREELAAALEEFGRTGRGVVIYVRTHGGARACGLLGPDAAARATTAVVAAGILADLGLPNRRP